MTDPTVREAAIALYDRFTHEGMERRAFMARMIALAGSAVAAEALIAGIAASPAAAAPVVQNDLRIVVSHADLQLGGGRPVYRIYTVALARPHDPRQASLHLERDGLATVLVIHENRGLNDHIRDVARRLALAGYRAVAPDFLSPAGGTPVNEDSAREMIGKLDLSRSIADGVAMLDEFGRGGKVGAVGFCWGGAFVNRLAVAAGADLDAGVVFYGPAPGPAEAPKVVAPLLIQLAGLDTRVNATGFPWVEALRAAGKPVTFQLYDGVNHAFHNDTSAERYDAAAARLAWDRTLRFFHRHLR